MRTSRGYIASVWHGGGRGRAKTVEPWRLRDMEPEIEKADEERGLNRSPIKKTMSNQGHRDRNPSVRKGRQNVGGEK